MSEQAVLAACIVALYAQTLFFMRVLFAQGRRLHREDIQRFGPKPANFPNPPSLSPSPTPSEVKSDE